MFECRLLPAGAGDDGLFSSQDRPVFIVPTGLGLYKEFMFHGDIAWIRAEPALDTCAAVGRRKNGPPEPPGGSAVCRMRRQVGFGGKRVVQLSTVN